jgi:hypothetical protein
VVPAREGAALEVVQPQRVLQLPIVVFHSPAQLGQVDQPLQQGVGREVREPVLDRLGFAVGPLDQQPAHRQLPTAGGAAQPDPGRTHPQRHEPGGQRLAVGAFAPGDRRGCRLAHVQHQLPQRRAALAVARPRPPPPARVRHGLGHWIAVVMRSASRRRTGVGSQGLG